MSMRTRFTIWLKVLWTVTIWCICISTPYIVLCLHGAVMSIVASILSFLFWMVAGELWVGLYIEGKRLYTAMPQMFVFFNSILSILIGLFCIIARR